MFLGLLHKPVSINNNDLFMNSINQKLKTNWGLLSTFLREMDGYIDTLQSQIHELSVAEVRSVLHQMLGSGRILGNEKIVDYVIMMQDIIKGSQKPEHIVPLLSDVKQDHDALFEYLTAHRDYYAVSFWYDRPTSGHLVDLPAADSKIDLSVYNHINDFQEALLEHRISTAVLEFEMLTPAVEELLDLNESTSEIHLLLISKLENKDAVSFISKYSCIGGILPPEVSTDRLLQSIKVISNGRDLTNTTQIISS